LAVPRVREKIAGLLFDLESGEKINAVKQDLRLVSLSLKELRSEKVKKLMEITLATINYLNSGGKNPKAPIMGFRLESLNKMVEAVSPKDKTSVLQFIVKQLFDKYPALLKLPDELPSIEPAAIAITGYLTEIISIKKSLQDLQTEIKKCDADGDVMWATYIGSSGAKIQNEVADLDKKMCEVTDTIAYFGESTTDIPAFFINWSKFIQAFQKAVKYVDTMKKRDDAIRKKEEARMKKEKEKELIEGFVGNMKVNGSMRGMKPEQRAIMQGLNKAATNKDENLIGNITDQLKNQQTFTRLRGHRAVRELNEAGTSTSASKGTIGKKGKDKSGDASKVKGGRTIRETSLIVDDILSLIAPAPASAKADNKAHKSILTMEWGKK